MGQVSISGTHSTGKTTLLKSLKSYSFFKDYIFIPGPTRTLKEQGFSINNNDNNYDVTQLLCSTIDCLNLQQYEYKNIDCIQDRSLLDTLVYTEYLYQNKKVSQITKDLIEQLFVLNKKKYNFFFITSIQDVKLIDDGTRSLDSQFREDVNHLFFKNLDKYKLPYIVLEGTNEERVQQLINKLTII